MTPLIKWGIWQRRWSMFWWSFGVAIFIFLNMIFYPSFKDQAAELQKSFDNLPDAAVQLMGGSADFFSPIGFVNSQIFFMMLPLLLGALAISLGSSLIAREEQDRTIEVLLARPVSRNAFLIAKSLVGIIVLGAVTLVGLLTILITARLVELAVPAGLLAVVTVACFLLSLSAGAVAFLFTAVGKARAASIGIATAVAFGGYLISSLAGTVSWLEAPSKFFPFYYYQSEAILRETYNWANTLFLIILILLCGLLSWFYFRRRDLG